MRVISRDSKFGHGLIRAIIGVVGLISLTLTGIWTFQSRTDVPARAKASGTTGSNSAKVRAQYGQLPTRFEQNQGQVDSRVKFLARGQGYTLFLTSHDAVLTLKKSGPVSGLRPSPPDSRNRRMRSQEPEVQNSKLETRNSPLVTSYSGDEESVLRMKLVGGNSSPQVLGQDELPGASNYFIGNNPKNWHTDVPAYAKVRYGEVYRGVDLVYYGRQGQLENDFVAKPGSDPGCIRLNIAGASKLAVDGDGDLVVNADGGKVRFKRPEAYQEVGGRRQVIEVGYELAGKREVKFNLGKYDHGRALVIDPVLIYSTYLGGSGGDVAYGIAVDTAGEAFVTGNTNSSDFPILGAEQGGNGGAGDAFVAKLNTTGTALVYSTYLGGNSADTGAGIFVDASGDAFVTGTTSSPNFPTTATAFQTIYGGNGDAFVTELNSAGNKLVYSSYLGGGGADFGQAIAVDSSKNAYVTGQTLSINFPVVTPLQATNGGGSDAFVAKVNFTGTALIYSTYLGGTDADVAQAIQVDGAGNAYIAGYTFSTNFPTQSPLFGANAGGGADAFVAKLNPAGSALVFSTYLGGSLDDRAFGIGLDSTGNIYVAGSTQSADFPTISGSFQTSLKGATNAFVTKLNPAGTSLTYSTYLGGSGTDQANGIAVDGTGNAYVAGFTESSDFPTQQAIQAVLGITGGSFCGSNPCSDSFVTQLNPAGTALTTSTFLGGGGSDFGKAIALDSSGGVYVAGSTQSANFPATAGAYLGNLAGVAGNAFAAKIASSNLPSIAVTPQKINFGNQPLSVRSPAQTVSVINEGTAALSITAITPAGDFQETDDCIGTVSSGGGTCTINITYTPTTLGSSTQQISITDNSANSPHIITVSGTGVSAATAVTLSPGSLSFANQQVLTKSASQTVTLTNTGTSTLNITLIAASGDFLQTNTCVATLDVLAVGQSCTISVSFQPTASGARTGTLTISDNASGSPQGVALSGNGLAEFSLAATSTTASVTVGTATASYTVSASSASNFSGSITLACSTGITCAFNPASILAGQSSTLTASGLTATMPNPFNFTITGISGSQSASLGLTILMADYSLAGSPALDTIVSGGTANYTVSVTPSNGFNQAVALSCLSTSLPAGAKCSFSQATVTPSGSAATVNLSIFTNKVAATPPQPRAPFQGAPPLLLWLASMLLLGAIVHAGRRRRESGAPRSLLLTWKFSALGLALLLLSGLTGCRPANTSSNTGTATGNYTISIVGTLSSNTAVQRTTTVNLSVT
ncbi:MAG TPA: SBBP repeat-containing protein [Terriglobia bacterium]|nr:SBBP repeat-containing protein [Terriglobia bacterium]